MSIHVGSTLTVFCTDANGVDGVNEVTVRAVDKLGCGCLRYTTNRPGAPAEQRLGMQILSGCSAHKSGLSTEGGAR